MPDDIIIIIAEFENDAATDEDKEDVFPWPNTVDTADAFGDDDIWWLLVVGMMRAQLIVTVLNNFKVESCMIDYSLACSRVHMAE